MNHIPKITNPLGSHWYQPSPETILIDDNVSLMSTESFKKLKEYSTSFPSGVYVGKMWKSLLNDVWFLRWYGEHENPSLCSINKREILLVD